MANLDWNQRENMISLTLILSRLPGKDFLYWLYVECPATMEISEVVWLFSQDDQTLIPYNNTSAIWLH